MRSPKARTARSYPARPAGMASAQAAPLQSGGKVGQGGKTGAAVIRRAEWAVAIAATTILAGLHLTFLLNAGGLWRDEVNSVNLANLPSLRDMWLHLQYDSFPIGWFAVLRAWTRIGPGSTDLGIRTLGVLVGLGVLAVLWRNARALGRPIPLVSLTLLGFNSAVIGYGDSIRGYGLGILTGLLSFGMIWEVADTPTPRRLGLRCWPPSSASRVTSSTRSLCSRHAAARPPWLWGESRGDRLA